MKKLKFFFCLLCGAYIVYVIFYTGLGKNIGLGYDNLWEFLWEPIWEFTTNWLFDDWDWEPTPSTFVNICIGFFHGIVIAVAVPVVVAFIVVSVVYYYALPYATGYIGYAAGAIFVHITSNERWFKIGFDAGFRIGLGFLIGLSIYGVFLPIIWHLLLKPVFKGILLLFVGFRKEGMDMVYDPEEGMFKTEQTEQEVLIPEVFDEKQIEAGIKKYSSDQRLLTVFIDGLTQRYKTQSQMKVIEKQLEYLNIGKEYLDKVYEARVAQRKLERVDKEQNIELQKIELEKKRLAKEDERLELEDRVERKSLELKLAELEAKVAQLQEKQSGVDKEQAAVEKAKKNISDAASIRKTQIKSITEEVEALAEEKRKIREKYPPEQAEEIIDLLEQAMARRGDVE